MFVRTFIVALLLLLAGSNPASPPVPEEGSWVQGVPEDRHLTALAALWAAERTAAPVDAAAALAGFSQDEGHTRASGLAQLAAGLILLEAEKPQDAILHLGHSDIARTKLGDHAALALARAYEKTGEYQLSAAQYAAVVKTTPNTTLLCAALLRGAEVQSLVGQQDAALAMIERALGECPGREAQALLQKGAVAEKRGDPKAAAEAYDQLDCDYATTTQARDAAPRLRALTAYLPQLSPAGRTARDLRKAMTVFDAGQYATVIPLLRSLILRPLPPADADLVRVRFARALIETGREKDATPLLAAVPAGSAQGAEAAYFQARIHVRAARTPFAYEQVVGKYPHSPWAEESLLNLAHYYQKDARDAEALPYFQRLYEQFPEGRLIDRATWRVGWAEYEKGRFEQAATIFERAARRVTTSSYTGAFLYWAGRARREQGRQDEARRLFEETIERFKYAYHGLRARDALGRLPGGASSTDPAVDPKGVLAEPYRTRVHDLLMLDRFDQAGDELRGAPASPQARATLAFLQWRQGNLRPAITAMKRAYPEYVTVQGDQLPDQAWRILFPIQYTETLTLRSAQVGLDPALVAALICQESTFDPTAVSVVGARGLMQLMPPTGRELARRTGVVFGANTLYDPQAGLELGTHYLKNMIDTFGGRVERALAAYNAGPGRVARWTSGRNMTAEEFVDYIPYPETRLYVMAILAGQEQYRRIYGLPYAGALALVAEQGVPDELKGVDAPQPALRPLPPPVTPVVAKAAGKKPSAKRTSAARKPRRAPRRTGHH